MSLMPCVTYKPFMLNFIMLCVIMLCVMMPFVVVQKIIVGTSISVILFCKICLFWLNQFKILHSKFWKIRPKKFYCIGFKFEMFESWSRLVKHIIRLRSRKRLSLSQCRLSKICFRHVFRAGINKIYYELLTIIPVTGGLYYKTYYGRNLRIL